MTFRLSALIAAIALAAGLCVATPGTAFSDPAQTHAQVASISLVDRTPYVAEIVFRTRTGKNEPTLRLYPSKPPTSVYFEGTYQLGGTVRVGPTDVQITPREVTLDKYNAKLWYVEKNAHGEYYFK